VLRPGGRLVILESSRPENLIWRWFHTLYLRWILPYLGGSISGNLSAYCYLSRSSRNYYSLKQMGEILERAGFEVLRKEPLFLGSVMLLTVRKKALPDNHS
jgi:demethylmenaquinone methyltransferase/2-methoxy-6-polyprenyl-1,4-benzoquinol methylase